MESLITFPPDLISGSALTFSMTSISVGSPRYSAGTDGSSFCVGNGGGGAGAFPRAVRFLLYLPLPCFTPDQFNSSGSSLGSSESGALALLLICATRGSSLRGRGFSEGIQ